MFNAIEKSKDVLLSKFINALGIRLVGKESSDILAQNFKDIEQIKLAKYDDLSTLDGIGEKMASSIVEFFASEKNIEVIDDMIALGVRITNKYNNSTYK